MNVKPSSDQIIIKEAIQSPKSLQYRISKNNNINHEYVLLLLLEGA